MSKSYLQSGITRLRLKLGKELREVVDDSKKWPYPLQKERFERALLLFEHSELKAKPKCKTCYGRGTMTLKTPTAPDFVKTLCNCVMVQVPLRKPEDEINNFIRWEARQTKSSKPISDEGKPNTGDGGQNPPETGESKPKVKRKSPPKGTVKSPATDIGREDKTEEITPKAPPVRKTRKPNQSKPTETPS